MLVTGAIPEHWGQVRPPDWGSGLSREEGLTFWNRKWETEGKGGAQGFSLQAQEEGGTS